jgi:hypothetical protein
MRSAISRHRARLGSKFSGLQADWMKRWSCDGVDLPKSSFSFSSLFIPPPMQVLGVGRMDQAGCRRKSFEKVRGWWW